MKKVFTILTFLFFSVFLFAQMEIGRYHIDINGGASLIYTVDYLDSSLVKNNGSHITWDLSEEESPIVKEVKILKTKIPSITYQENYEVQNGQDIVIYQKNSSRLNEIGFVLKTKYNPNRIVLYKKPIVFSEKKLFYGARFSDSTSFEIILEREELPIEITDNLPLKVKEIKLFGLIKRQYHYDADGRFEFKDKSVSALRLRIDESIELNLYDHKSGGEIPVYNKNYLKKIYRNVGKRTYYYFFSNTSRFYFAKVSCSKSNKSYVIEYQSNKKGDEVLLLKKYKKVFLIYPNPTYDYAKIIFSNYKPGDYELEIYSIIGKKIWGKSIKLDENTLMKYNFSFLRKGAYLMALKDKYGNIIATRKLIIISI